MGTIAGRVARAGAAFAAVWLPTALVAGISYTAFLSKGLGRTGLETAGALVTVPGAVLFFAVVVWVPLWLIMSRRGRSLRTMLLVAAAYVVVLVLVLCGPSCFWLHGSGSFLGFWGLVFCLGGSAAHYRLHKAWT